MNKKFIELARQAGLKFPSEGSLSPAELKFAQLIVGECAEVIDEKISPPSHPMNSIGYKLKEHFGVEE